MKQTLALALLAASLPAAAVAQGAADEAAIRAPVSDKSHKFPMLSRVGVRRLAAHVARVRRAVRRSMRKGPLYGSKKPMPARLRPEG